MIDEAYKRTKELLLQHKDELHALAARLLEREVIFKEDLEQIFGKRKWDDERKIETGHSENGSAGLNGTEKKTEPAATPTLPVAEKSSPESPVA